MIATMTNIYDDDDDDDETIVWCRVSELWAPHNPNGFCSEEKQYVITVNGDGDGDKDSVGWLDLLPRINAFPFHICVHTVQS